jgi:cobalt-zinc-cadmium efflux system membrane fusion protein
LLHCNYFRWATEYDSEAGHGIMGFSMDTAPRTVTLGAAIVAAVLSFAAGSYLAVAHRNPPKLTLGIAGAVAAPETSGGKDSSASPPDSVELSDDQLKSVKVEAANLRDFPIEKVAIGSIDFNEEMLTQVFTPNQGA